MLNNSGITKDSYGSPTQILANVELQYSVGCVVAQTLGTTVGSKKIALAGTPVYGNIDSLTTPFVAETTTTDVSNAVGVLLHDVDVTAGNANATLLLFGFVNKNRLDATVKTKCTSAVAKALGGKVTFVTL